MATARANSSPGPFRSENVSSRQCGHIAGHLKLVPESREIRDLVRATCIELTAALDNTPLLSKHRIEITARSVLRNLALPDVYLGWTMVVLASAFWRDQVTTVPHSRRLLLLPHCGKHASPTADNSDGPVVDCGRLDSCAVAGFRASARRLGYQVQTAENTSNVLKTISRGQVDAIVGVASLGVLERALDTILAARIPCMAVPLLSGDRAMDEDWIAEIIDLPYQQPSYATKATARTYAHLMSCAAGLFEPGELARLAPRLRTSSSPSAINRPSAAGIDPIAGTEAIAYDFLARGGKHSRPFITLAVYDALRRSSNGFQPGTDHACALPDAVKRTALSIETFHKASLVHDDIQDDDQFRYGEATLHRKYGTPTAINVGDYLIGLGYRLVSRESKTLGPDVVSDILDRLADAHMKLSEGQGAELLWRDSRDKRLSSRDALNIYALKTAPAFEAALYAGLRLAGPVSADANFVAQFARNLGLAFQIVNDLNDWHGDDHNKLGAASDTIGGRPTVLWALALESLSPADRSQLEGLVESLAAEPAENASVILQVRDLYHQAGVFEQAERLVEIYRQRAQEVAAHVDSEELRDLLYYLIDSVLDCRVCRPGAPVDVLLSEAVTTRI